MIFYIVEVVEILELYFLFRVMHGKIGIDFTMMCFSFFSMIIWLQSFVYQQFETFQVNGT